MFSTSDLIVEKIEDAIHWIKDYIEDPGSKSVRSIDVIDDGIEAFDRLQK